MLTKHNRMCWDVCPIALVRSCPGRQRWGIGTCSAGQMRTRLPFKLAL